MELCDILEVHNISDKMGKMTLWNASREIHGASGDKGDMGTQASGRKTYGMVDLCILLITPIRLMQIQTTGAK